MKYKLAFYADSPYYQNRYFNFGVNNVGDVITILMKFKKNSNLFRKIFIQIVFYHSVNSIKLDRTKDIFNKYLFSSFSDYLDKIFLTENVSLTDEPLKMY